MAKHCIFDSNEIVYSFCRFLDVPTACKVDAVRKGEFHLGYVGRERIQDCADLTIGVVMKNFVTHLIQWTERNLSVEAVFVAESTERDNKESIKTWVALFNYHLVRFPYEVSCEQLK